MSPDLAPQRRQRDVHDVDPVVEVFAESALLDGRLEIAVGRHDHPDIDRELFAAADGPHGALLEHAQQLGLEPQGHVPDLVQEDRAAGSRG